jgi:hypothetical protein
MQAHILICDLYNLNKCYYYPTFSITVLGYTYPFCLYRTIIMGYQNQTILWLYNTCVFKSYEIRLVQGAVTSTINNNDAIQKTSPLPFNKKKNGSCHFVEPALEQMVNKFWELDSFEKEAVITQDDALCGRIFVDRHKRSKAR